MFSSRLTRLMCETLALATAVAISWPGICQAQTSRSGNATDSATVEPKIPGAKDNSKSSKRRGLKPPKVYGFIQVHYRYSASTGEDSVAADHDDFRVQRARIGVKGDIYDWLSYTAEVDPRAPEITGILRDAYMEFGVIPRHVIRVGQQKTQFGYENNESSTNLYAVNRSELSDALQRGVNLRDIGVGLIGNVKLGKKGLRFEDAITVVNGNGANTQADDTATKSVWGRVGLRWRKDPSNFTARLGVSGASGDFVEPADTLVGEEAVLIKFKRLGFDVELDHPWFFVSAEYVSGTDEIDGEEDDPSGYYVNLVGKTPHQIGPIVRYDTLDDEFKRWTFGAYYGLPEKPWRLMLNYELRKLRDGVRQDDKFYVWTQVKY